jgi:hypothetical protein
MNGNQPDSSLSEPETLSDSIHWKHSYRPPFRIVSIENTHTELLI